MPANGVSAVFGEVVKPLFAKAKVNMGESRTLAAIHDALLPKLLSGEIRVAAAEKVTWEAGGWITYVGSEATLRVLFSPMRMGKRDDGARIPTVSDTSRSDSPSALMLSLN